MSRAVERVRVESLPEPRVIGPSALSSRPLTLPVALPVAGAWRCMHLLFDIFQGIGIAAAVGIRPFLPALLAGALAAGNVEIHFDHTKLSFLQSAPFLLVLVVLVVLLALVERRFGHAWL